MPPLTAHVHFASILLPRLKPRYDAVWFLRGSVAPDCFDRDDPESWRSSHFVGARSCPDPELFLSRQGPGVKSKARAAVLSGYYAHLWLDEQFRPGGMELPIAAPPGMPQEQIRQLIQSQTRRCDLLETREFLRPYITLASEWDSEPVPADVTEISFWSHGEVSRLIARIVSASQSPLDAAEEPAIIDPRFYCAMLSDLAGLCAESLARAGIGELMLLREHDVALDGVTPGGGRVHLRPLTEADWPFLCAWNSDHEVLYFSEGDDIARWDPEQVKQIYRTVSQNAFCFIIECDGHPVGECWLQRMNLQRVLDMFPGQDVRRIDLMIGEKSYWGRGIGSTTIAMLASFGLRREHADVIYIPDVADYNVRSLGAFQKAGFHVVRDTLQRPGGKAVRTFDLAVTREEYLLAGEPRLDV